LRGTAIGPLYQTLHVAARREPVAAGGSTSWRREKTALKKAHLDSDSGTDYRLEEGSWAGKVAFRGHQIFCAPAHFCRRISFGVRRAARLWALTAAWLHLCTPAA